MKDSVQNDPNDLLDKLAAQGASLPGAECTRRIREVCTRDLEPCQTVTLKARRTASFLLVAAVFSAMLAYGWSELEVPSSADILAIVGWGIVQSAVLFFAFRQPGTRLSLQNALVYSMPLLFLLFLIAEHSGTLSFREFIGSDSERAHALDCGLLSFIGGGLATLGLLALWRRTDPFTPLLTGAVSGLVGGLAVAAPIEFVCQGKESWHLGLGHVLSFALVVILGAVLGRRWLSP